MYESGPGQLAPYQASLLSLPKDATPPVPLCQLLVGDDLDDYQDFERRVKLSSEELAGVAERCEEAG